MEPGTQDFTEAMVSLESTVRHNVIDAIRSHQNGTSSVEAMVEAIGSALGSDEDKAQTIATYVRLTTNIDLDEIQEICLMAEDQHIESLMKENGTAEESETGAVASTEVATADGDDNNVDPGDVGDDDMAAAAADDASAPMSDGTEPKSSSSSTSESDDAAAKSEAAADGDDDEKSPDADGDAPMASSTPKAKKKKSNKKKSSSPWVVYVCNLRECLFLHLLPSANPSLTTHTHTHTHTQHTRTHSSFHRD